MSPCLQSLVPLRHARHRTVLDAVWSTQLALGGCSANASLLEYLKGLPTPKLAGMVASHEDLPAHVRTAMGPLCEKVAAAAHAWGLLAAIEAPHLHERALLMSMRGAQPHTDIPRARWRGKLFWAVSLQDTDTDVLFGNLEHRVALAAGTLLVFDPCQPHAVVAREQPGFWKRDFPRSRVQLFAGGDFPAQDWGALGVRHPPTEDDLTTRRDVEDILVHPHTCFVRPADPPSRRQVRR